MKRATKVMIAAAAIGGVAVAGTGWAMAGNPLDDDATDTAISGPALERASRAALDHTGGGQVTETEVGDEESYYEVEVTLEDGSQVDVQLDEDFAVVGEEADDDTTEDEDEAEG